MSPDFETWYQNEFKKIENCELPGAVKIAFRDLAEQAFDAGRQYECSIVDERSDWTPRRAF